MYYIGRNHEGRRELFRSTKKPTASSHGDRYMYVVGPFRTKRGATFMLNHGHNNPHCITVSQAEKLANQ